ncbi:MAG: ComEC/Rec2 family competence protein [Candidatus Saccharibacteria bacterium]|nr:ComEC/Rec2 family competence protein [Candidatus Saccharibacteria bacterium]
MPRKTELEPLFEKNVVLSGSISDDVDFKKNDYRIRLKTNHGPIYVMIERMPKGVELGRSDLISLKGKIQAGFGNYVAFMYHPEIIKVSHPSMPDFSKEVRDAFSKSVIEQIDNSEQSNLALSYLTGQKTLLTEEQSEKLRLVGLAHVVVASGYHLSVVVSLAKKYLGKISRFATLSGALILLTAYISVTGFTPSMARAGMMTAIVLFAWYYGRRFHPARLIMYVMAISLVMDGGYISNLAWQLSFASYTGIIFITPLITNFLYGDKKPGYFANIIIASVSAQIFCLPFTLYYFGSIPVFAFVSNLLITPLIPFAMLGTFLLGITRIPVFTFLTKLILAFQLKAIDFLVSFPWANIDFGAGKIEVFLLFIPIVATILILRRCTRYSYRPSYVKICA